MKIICISDTHSKHPFIIPEGDILIHAGDVSSMGKNYEIIEFLEWFNSLPHKYKVFIAGNHDWGFQRFPKQMDEILKQYPNITYLNETGVTIEGIKIWGSPWTPYFFNWAFNYDPKIANQHWNKIPLDTNILITHGPPYNILDFVDNGYNKNPNVGCVALRDRLSDLKELKLHVFGHIHEQRGKTHINDVTFMNASMLDDRYKPVKSEVETFEY